MTRTITGHLPWASDALIDLPAIPKPPEWMEWGACVGEDPETFYPPQGADYGPAAEVCARCHVQGACQAWGDRVETTGIGARGGLAHLYGYLGGETPAERRRRRKENAMRLPVIRWTPGMTVPLPEGYVPSYVEVGMGRTIDEARLYWILDALLAEHPEAERLRKVAAERPGLSLQRAEDTGAAPDYAGLLVVFLVEEPLGMFDARLLVA